MEGGGVKPPLFHMRKIILILLLGTLSGCAFLPAILLSAAENVASTSASKAIQYEWDAYSTRSNGGN